MKNLIILMVLLCCTAPASAMTAAMRYMTVASAGGVAPPAAPTGHSTVSGNTLITLHPGTAAGATSYKYYLRAGADPTTSTYDATGTATDGATVGSLTNGTAYHVGYTAANTGGESVLSTIDTVTPNIATFFTQNVSSNDSAPDQWRLIGFSASGFTPHALTQLDFYVKTITGNVSGFAYKVDIYNVSGRTIGSLIGSSAPAASIVSTGWTSVTFTTPISLPAAWAAVINHGGSNSSNYIVLGTSTAGIAGFNGEQFDAGPVFYSSGSSNIPAMRLY